MSKSGRPSAESRKKNSTKAPKTNGSAKRARKASDTLPPFLAIVLDLKSSEAKVTAALDTLALSLGTEGRAAFEEATQKLPDSLSKTQSDVIGLELSLADSALRASNGDSASWMQFHPLWGALSRVAASTHISAMGLAGEPAKATERRRLLAIDRTSGNDSPLIATDARGFWTPGTMETAEAEWASSELLAPDCDDRLPLCREVSIRLDFLRLAALSRQTDAKEVKKHGAALRVLARGLKAVEAMVLNESLRTDQGMEWCAQVLTIAGRNPEVWRHLSAERKHLIAAGTVASEHVVAQWADAVGASWCTIPESEQQLATLPPIALAALVRAARDHNSSWLIKASRDALSKVFDTRTPSDALRSLDYLAERSAIDREWVDAIRAKQRRLVSKPAVISIAEENPIERLRTVSFAEELIAADPTAALTAVSIAWNRLQAANDEQLQSLIANGVQRLRSTIQTIEATSEEIRKHVGVCPPRISDAVTSALAELKGLTSQMSDIQPVRDSQPSLGRGLGRVQDTSALTTRLHSLRFDPARARQADEDLRLESAAALVTEFESPTSVLVTVIKSVDSFPPEAIGLLTQLAISRRNVQTLEAIRPLTERNDWARRLWDEAVLRFGKDDITAIPIQTAWATETRDRLFLRFQTAASNQQYQARISAIDTTAKRVVKSVANEILYIASELERSATNLSGEE